MDLKQRKQELDARIAARREAINRRLGLDSPAPEPADPAASENPGGPVPSGPEETATAEEPVAPADPAADSGRKDFGPAAASGRKAAGSSGRKDGGASGKFAKVLSVFDNGLEIPGLFTIPGIVLKIVFILFCLSAVLNLFWAIRYCFFYHPYHTFPYDVAYPGVYVAHPSYWWMFWPVLFEVGCAYLLWWLCAKKKK